MNNFSLEFLKWLSKNYVRFLSEHGAPSDYNPDDYYSFAGFDLDKDILSVMYFADGEISHLDITNKMHEMFLDEIAEFVKSELKK